MGADNITYANTRSITGGSLADIKPEQRAGARRGAELLALSLLAEGVDTLFGYPGGANLEIFDVLPRHGIRCIRTEHEQGAVHAAQGYARATGKVGVCLATSGPGATNLVTGIADANSDSTPLVAITGNVPSHLLGKNAFQEVDIVGITAPITKRNYLVLKVGEVPEVVREAFALAGGNRPGPVLIDIPKDIQQQYPKDPEGNYVEPRIPAVLEAPELAIGAMTEQQVEEACRLIAEARRPVIYAGGGIISSNSPALLQRLAEKIQCPVTTTLMGHGAFPPEHELFLDTLGMHGSMTANVAVNEADLVLALGVRFDDRVTGKVDAFIAEGKIIHVDIDRNELNKNKTVTLAVCADLATALQQLCDQAMPRDCPDWLAYLKGLKQEHPYPAPASEGISPQEAIALLSDLSGGDAIVSLGVGQHQMWAMQHYRTRRSRSFLSSSGFGTMGYGLPAAIGAKIGCPDRLVMDIDGDGSLNMTIHELATCHRFKVGVKVVVINNQWLGMVRQWQDMIYEQHRSGSDLSDPLATGDDLIYPNFIKIAEGYGISGERVTQREDLRAACERLLADPDEPYLLDIIVEAEENVYPMIPAGGTYRDIIMGDEQLQAVDPNAQGSNV